jgi:hypothetical protein
MGPRRCSPAALIDVECKGGHSKKQENREAMLAL